MTAITTTALRQIAEAKAACTRCPVRIDCLSYALEPARTRGHGAAPPKNDAGRSSQLLQPPGHRGGQK